MTARASLPADVPISFFKHYRATASSPDPETGPGPFTCINRQDSSSTSWSGDGETPNDGQVYYYLVTAQTAGGDESTAGAASDGTLRVVDTASPCD